MRKIFGIGQDGVWLSRRSRGARRQDEHSVLRFAAEHLLPGEGDDVELLPVEVLRKGRRGRVTECQSLTMSGNPIAVRNANAGGCAIPGKDDIVLEIDLGEIGQRAIGRFQDARARDLELLCDVRRPVLAEGLPHENIHAARAEHGPHGHFECAGVRSRYDADKIIIRDAQNGARFVDGKFEFGFSGLGPVRPA